MRLALIKRSPKFYALTYVLAIPLWAGLYMLISGDFYHSTVLRESKLEELRLSIQQDLLKVVERVYECPQRSGFACRIKNLSVIGLRCEQGTFIFETPFARTGMMRGSRGNLMFRPVWTLHLPRLEQGGPRVFARVDKIPNFMLDEFKNEKNRDNDIYVAEPMWGPLRGTEFDPEFERYRPPKKGSIDGILDLEDGLYEKLELYSAAREGSPATVGGIYGYLSFFYFSIVTITTLGYGDIVPMTGWARGLVSAEALFGILMAGLFLNATARKHKP